MGPSFPRGVFKHICPFLMQNQEPLSMLREVQLLHSHEKPSALPCAGASIRLGWFGWQRDSSPAAAALGVGSRVEIVPQGAGFVSFSSSFTGVSFSCSWLRGGAVLWGGLCCHGGVSSLPPVARRWWDSSAGRLYALCSTRGFASRGNCQSPRAATPSLPEPGFHPSWAQLPSPLVVSSARVCSVGSGLWEDACVMCRGLGRVCQVAVSRLWVLGLDPSWVRLSR